MWSVGVLLYVLLTGCSPFGGDSKQETFCNISRCRLDFPDDLFEEVSQEAQDLIRRLIVKNPRYARTQAFDLLFSSTANTTSGMRLNNLFLFFFSLPQRETLGFGVSAALVALQVRGRRVALGPLRLGVQQRIRGREQPL